MAQGPGKSPKLSPMLFQRQKDWNIKSEFQRQTPEFLWWLRKKLEDKSHNSDPYVCYINCGSVHWPSTNKPLSLTWTHQSTNKTYGDPRGMDGHGLGKKKKRFASCLDGSERFLHWCHHSGELWPFGEKTLSLECNKIVWFKCLNCLKCHKLFA